MQRILRMTSLVLVLLVLVSMLVVPAQALTRDQRRQIMKSSVLILAMQVQNGKVVNIPWGGSGTIIDPKGLILTNNHVVQASNEWNTLGILITSQSDRKPEPTYLAQVVVTDEDVDLAVIRIVSDFKGNAVDPAKLNLATVALGDADSLEIGDEVSIFGYPGIGQGTITLTEGKVAGFLQEQGIDYQRAWIKTDATISGGNSGGTAVDTDGKLVAIPTRSSDVDVRKIADTNGDGVVDENDEAVPIGGFINLLRPINLAFPLINKARNTTVQPGKQQPVQPGTKPSSGSTVKGVSFAPFVFSEEMDNDGQPADPATSFPDTILSLYAFTDFRGMKDGTGYEYIWAIDGESVVDKSYAWDVGTEGTFYLGLKNGGDTLPAGEYTLQLIVGGTVVQSGGVTVGSAQKDPSSRPSSTSKGVVLSGYIYDAYTGDAIEGAYVIILKPGITVKQFAAKRSEDMVAAYGITDSDGYYSIAPALARGYEYGVVILADGYEPLTADGALSVDTTDPDEVEMEYVEMVPQ